MSNRALFAPADLGALLCGACGGEGTVERSDGIDACGRCVRRAEADWREREQQRRRSMWEEQVNGSGAGAQGSTVVLEAKRGRLVLTLGRGALEMVPWFRGGVAVAVLLGRGADAGRMRVVRGDTHRLRTAVRGDAAARGLDKLPPVSLAMDLPAHMAPDAAHGPETVAYRVDRGMVEVVLPPWAAPPVPAVAPVTSYASGHFLPVEQREGAAP